MNTKITNFEDLHIWQNAQQLAQKIYLLADKNSSISKDFSLKDQLKSAAISISDNIAEGFEYNNNPDFYRFLRIAKGSCGEIRNKLHFIKRMNFEEEAVILELCSEAKNLGNQIGKLMEKVKVKIQEQRTKIKPAANNVTHNT
ncbi:MAG TPA: four helix bundle protein [Lacibacter sp.]|nr:four helix bundle protein [Lacibacter sp.]HMO88440.1 four helix bundle protein [Lacibacter sp.]HMP86758.1 four helix bundle protein [Lacibacter sp.]